MAAKIIKFLRSDSDWLAKRGEAGSYLFIYTIVGDEFHGKPDESSHTRRHSVIVAISRNTRGEWHLSEDSDLENLEKVLYQYTYDLIQEKVRNDSLKGEEEIKLFNDAPPKCPYDPEKINMRFDEPIVFPVNRPFGFKH